MAVIIPDIHGRSFWKNVVKGRENEEIIFLGDYLDPYCSEEEFVKESEKEDGDILEMIMKNFEDIIEFKKSHMDNVILLIGNHDFHYIYDSEYARGSRYMRFAARRVGKIFKENETLFQIAYEKEINGKHFIFSHAGITKAWLKYNFQDDWNEETIVSVCNEEYETGKYGFLESLCQISQKRGGYYLAGSMIWADVSEFFGLKDKDKFNNAFQVFGHSQLNDFPLITDYFADLDVRRGFEIKDDGIIYELDGKPAITYDELKKMYDK